MKDEKNPFWLILTVLLFREVSTPDLTARNNVKKVRGQNTCLGSTIKLRVRAELLREIVDRANLCVNWGIERAFLTEHDPYMPENLKWYGFNLLKICVSKNIFWYSILKQNQMEEETDELNYYTNETKAIRFFITLPYSIFDAIIRSVSIVNHLLSEGGKSNDKHEHFLRYIFLSRIKCGWR